MFGCPSSIPPIEHGKIVAGYRYDGAGNVIPQLACTGDRFIMYAETIQYGECLPFGSMIINPGCEVIFFKNADLQGDFNTYTEGTYPLVTKNMTFGMLNTTNDVPCIPAYLASCRQTYPTCVPTHGWETVTELDNTRGTVPTTFSYTKTIGRNCF